MFRSRHDNVDRLSQYIALVNAKVDPVAAATTAFGNLRALEKELNVYLQRTTLPYLTSPIAIEVDKSTFKTRTLAAVQSDAVRADFLVYVQRLKDSRELLDRILQQAPDNAAAHETMGLLASHEGNWQEAANWYAQAAKLDPQNYLDHYSYAQAAITAGLSEDQAPQIEASLRAATTLNPDFAAAPDQLAAFYARQNRNLDEAYKLELQAVQLEPGNVYYRINGANLLMRMKRPDGALAVLQTASQLTTEPALLAAIQSNQQAIQGYLAQEAQRRQQTKGNAAQLISAPTSPIADDAPPAADAETGQGPRRTATGTLSEVQCSSPAILHLKLVGGKKPIALRTRNYYKVPYSTLGFRPSGDLNPCTDLENKKAVVEYFEDANSSAEGQIVSIELHK